MDLSQPRDDVDEVLRADASVESPSTVESDGSSAVQSALRMTKQDLLSSFEESESNFDARFNKSISVVNSKEVGSVNKVDISPENGQPKATIFLAPGWLETLNTNKYLVRSLVEFGYRVISLEHPRHHGSAVDAGARHLAAINAVVEDTDLHGEKMFALASSLGAIDIAQYADPEKNPETHSKFKDFVLLNPAGLNSKDEKGKTRDVLHLLKNYLFGHMKQGKETKKLMAELEEELRVSSADNSKGNGMPLSTIAELLREKMTKAGMSDLKSNPILASLEAVRVGGSRVQEELRRLRQNGHKIFVFTSENDKLLPGQEYDLKVAGEPGVGPKGENIEYGSADAQVDQVTQLAGYHNTFRNVARSDFDNDQWMSIVWVNALLEDLISKGKV